MLGLGRGTVLHITASAQHTHFSHGSLLLVWEKVAASSLSEHKESTFGGLPILGIHRTMDPLEERNCTLCMQVYACLWIDLPTVRKGLELSETDHVGHSSRASFNVMCAVTSPYRGRSPASMLSFKRKNQESLGETGREHPLNISSPPPSTWGKSWVVRGGGTADLGTRLPHWTGLSEAGCDHPLQSHGLQTLHAHSTRCGETQCREAGIRQ